MLYMRDGFVYVSAHVNWVLNAAVRATGGVRGVEEWDVTWALVWLWACGDMQSCTCMPMVAVLAVRRFGVKMSAQLRWQL